MWPRAGELRAFGFREPGELRDHLIALALSGSKVAIAGIWKHDYEPEGEAIETVGEMEALLDSAGLPSLGTNGQMPQESAAHSLPLVAGC